MTDVPDATGTLVEMITVQPSFVPPLTMRKRIYAVWQLIAPENIMGGAGFYLEAWPPSDYALERVKARILTAINDDWAPKRIAGQKLPEINIQQIIITFVCEAAPIFTNGPDMTGLEKAPTP